MFISVILLLFCYVNDSCCVKFSNEVPFVKNPYKKNFNFEPPNQDNQHYNLIVKAAVLSKIKPFWKNTGLCPPDPHQDAHKFLLSPDMRLNLFHIGSVAYNGISQVRIHWMLDLVQMRILSDLKAVYNFSNLDQLVYELQKNDLQPGFELMGNPSGYFTDFENSTQVYMWRDLIKEMATHYIDIFGIDYVKTWNFETWNEPDHHDFDKLNITIQGFLNYYDACSEGLYSADKRLRFGGPGGSCRIPAVGQSPICWALLEHCVHGKNYFTGQKDIRLDFISFHKKGNASTYLILDEEIETIQYIMTRFPSLLNTSFYNDEADPMKNWALPQWWRADSTYAAMVVKILLSHIYFYYVESGSGFNRDIKFDLLSSDNAFLSYFPNQFTERTLLARFQVNNTSPKYVEFIRKPVYSVFGLLSRMCPNILSADLTSIDGEILSKWDSNFGAIATCCASKRETVIILYNTADALPNGTDAHVDITIDISKSNEVSRPRWAILEVNNKMSNPYSVWKSLGMPSYPSIEEFSLMKDSEEPQMKGPWDAPSNKSWKFHIKVLNPGITLINICQSPKKLKQVNNIRFFQTWNKTLQISWNDKYNRCILTYNVLHSHFPHGPYRRLNKKIVIFPSFWYTCYKKKNNCDIKGFYKIYAVDYWGIPGPYSKSFHFGG